MTDEDEAYKEEFNRWFQRLLLNKTESCNIRDVFRGAHDKLEEEYIKMCRAQVERDRKHEHPRTV
jgi:hypothetical protein